MKKEDETIQELTAVVNLYGLLFYISKEERRPLIEIILQFIEDNELCRKHVHGYNGLQNVRPHRARR